MNDNVFERRVIPVPGLELYEADSNGHIWCNGPEALGRQARGTYHPQVGNAHETGYLRVGLYLNGQSVSYLVHYLVALAFHGPKPVADPDRAVVRAMHLDGDKLNNKPSNIYWHIGYFDSRARRRAREIYHGATLSREEAQERALKERRKRRAFTPQQVREIRRQLASGMTRKELSELHGCGPSAIGGIERGVTYVDVT